MTKAELINMVAEKCEGVSKTDIARVHDAIFETIIKALEVDKRYAVGGFGTFNVKERAERQGRNPKTGEPMTIGASKSVGFSQASALKERLK